MRNKKLIVFLLALLLVTFRPLLSTAANPSKTILFHLKTSLKHDDSQLCVAYNVIWAALESGMKVNVLIDADAVNTYKVGWRGKDGFEGYKLPGNLRSLLSKTFNKSPNNIPKTYGEYLKMLHDMGASFYINSAMLIVAKIEKNMGEIKNIGPKFFKPITLKEMIELRKKADYYMVY